MDKLAIKVAADVLPADFNANIVPAIGFNPARGFIAEGPIIAAGVAFELMFGITPSADIPPCAGINAVNVKSNEKSLVAAELAGLKRQCVIGPRGIAGRGEAIGVVRRLLKCAVFDFPLPADGFPTFDVIFGKIAAKKGLVAFADLDVFVFGMECRMRGNYRTESSRDSSACRSRLQKAGHKMPSQPRPNCVPGRS